MSAQGIEMEESCSSPKIFTFSSQHSSHIRFLLNSLEDHDDGDSIFQELCKFTTAGLDGSILLLQTCMDHLDIYGNDLKNMKLHALYASIFKHILDKPNFSTVFCESLRTAAINEEFLQNLFSALNLSASEKIGTGLALSESENFEIRMCGNNFCIVQISELWANSMAVESTSLIQNILMFLNNSEGLSKYVDAFMQMFDLVQLKEGDQFILYPFLTDELHEDNFRYLDMFSEGGEDDFDAILAEMEKEIGMADMMRELGYECTCNISQCKELLSLFLPLSDVTVAKILGTIIQTFDGLNPNQSHFSTFCSAFGSDSVLEMPSLNSWNVNVLIDSIKQLAPEINWIHVIELLDQEGFYIPNDSAFLFIMSLYRCACQDPFPLHAICGFVWKNVEGQLSFLKYAVSSSPEVFTFAHSERKLTYDDALSAHKFQPDQVNHAWSCLDLLKVLCQLAERGHSSFVRTILQSPLNHYPEALLLGMAHVNTAYNLIQYEVSSRVLPMVLNSASGNNLILNLWHANPSLLLRGLMDAMNSDPNNILRVFDACHEIEILSPVLNKMPYYFGVRLAALVSRKGVINLENWLSTNLVTYKDAFYEECLKFLKEILNRALDVPTNRFHPTDALLSTYLKASPTFLKFLQFQTDAVSSSHLLQEMEKLNATYMHVSSTIINGGNSGSTSSHTYADDIEAEANSYFHQMFSGHLAIDAMIQMLARFKGSSDKREQLIFECIVANLFEEYKFFSKYPDRELKVAAVIYGSLVKYHLVSHITLGIALRNVLDALRKPADSKIFAFGTKALEQFVDCIIEWPLYCNHILQISHLRAMHVDLVASIDSVLASAHTEPDVFHNAISDNHHCLIQTSTTNVEVPGSTCSPTRPVSPEASLQVSSQVLVPRRLINSLDERKASSAHLHNYMKPDQFYPEQNFMAPSSDASRIHKPYTAVGLPSLQSPTPDFPRSSRGTSARFGSALSVVTPVDTSERRETPIEAPATDIQDRISFIINNLVGSNIEVIAKEFTEILNEQYYPWFAQYMVMKRASIEPNFHDTYIKFLDRVNLKLLQKEIVKATYEICKALLRSELLKTSIQERKLLKSLGSWLGKITIGKNKFLRAKEIDLKSLIIEAYERGLMIAVIPFTSKILESCLASLAYRPPNPWTMAILALLAEIYDLPNLKMNLQLDIEALFKYFDQDVTDAIPSSLLVGRLREVKGNPDFPNKDTGYLQTATINEVKPGIISTGNQVEQPLDVAVPSAGGHSRIIPLYAPPPPPPPPPPQYHHISPGIMTNDEKLVSLGFSDQLPSQGLLPGQSSFSIPVPGTNIQQLVFNNKLGEFGLLMHFQRVLQIAMDRAVAGIVSGILQRSVSIATQTTKELVMKDYVIGLMAPDEILTRNVAHFMVAILAGSLARVTCKEPLRGSISKQLRSLLHGLSSSIDHLEQAILLVTNDNLDFGCVLIEQAATEKAVQMIDGEITQQLFLWRNYREILGIKPGINYRANHSSPFQTPYS